MLGLFPSPSSKFWAPIATVQLLQGATAWRSRLEEKHKYCQMVIKLAAALFANLDIYGGWGLRSQKLYTWLQNCDTIIHISISSVELISSSAGGPCTIVHRSQQHE